MLIILLLAYAISGALGMALIKRGGKGSFIRSIDKKINMKLDYELFLGIALYILSFILWISVLQLLPIVYISPIAYGLNFIFIALSAFIILKEKVVFMEVVGVLTIIIGVVLVSVRF